MKKHCFAAALCAAVLSLGLMGTAGARGNYSDLPDTHWAYPYMDRAAQLKILLGMGEGIMAPESELTWAQCLTIAARTFAPDAYAKAQGERWELVGYEACLEAGILLRPGREFLDVTGDLASLSRPISRQDTAVILSRAIPEKVKGTRTEYDPDTWERVTLTARDTLADYASLTPDYQKAVDRLFDLSIVQGSYVEEAGLKTYYFGGQDTLCRADGATLFIRALDKVDSARYGEKKTVTAHIVDEEGIPLTDALTVDARVGYSLSRDIPGDIDALHYYTIYPDDLYRSEWSEVTVSSACDEYTLVYYPMSDAQRTEQDFYDAVERGELSYGDYWWQPFNRYEMGENDYKHLLLFGDQNKRRYDNEGEAKMAQVTVTVPVWKINSKGEKYSSQASLQVSGPIAEDVEKIFTEIYNDPEQFPIRDVGGYSWRGDSATGEHNCGTAIDINANENYQIREGKIEAGTLWQPGENPYSIVPDGSVVRVFAKYGWTWGGDAWAWSSDDSTGYHDYMHFSYMGK